MVSTSNDEIAVEFNYGRSTEIRTIKIIPPTPPSGDKPITREYVILSKAGEKIILKAGWAAASGKGREIEYINIGPVVPRKTVQKDEILKENYILQTKESYELRLVCVWKGTDLQEVTPEEVTNFFDENK